MRTRSQAKVNQKSKLKTLASKSQDKRKDVAKHEAAPAGSEASSILVEDDELHEETRYPVSVYQTLSHAQ